MCRQSVGWVSAVSAAGFTNTHVLLLLELGGPGEDWLSTIHPKIIIAAQQAVDHTAIDAVTAQLELLALNTPEAVIGELQTLIPEYQSASADKSLGLVVA